VGFLDDIRKLHQEAESAVPQPRVPAAEAPEALTEPVSEPDPVTSNDE
jgi:hypothetical protein